MPYKNPAAAQTYQRNRTRAGYHRKRNKKLREAVYQKLGDKCRRCGFSDRGALHVDHVFDDGYAERKTLRSISQRLQAVLRDTQGRYQILCANCNAIKKYENNIKKYGEVK